MLEKLNLNQTRVLQIIIQVHPNIKLDLDQPA